MTSVHDVAAFIIDRTNQITAMKLQKLVYYCQAWSLVWDEKPIFPERIEAWANGPVIPELYDHHRGQYYLDEWPYGDASRLDGDSCDTIEAVLKFYCPRSSQWLSDLTHSEPPWLEAREGLPPGARSNREITLASMAEYYGSL